MKQTTGFSKMAYLCTVSCISNHVSAISHFQDGGRDRVVQLTGAESLYFGHLQKNTRLQIEKNLKIAVY